MKKLAIIGVIVVALLLVIGVVASAETVEVDTQAEFNTAAANASTDPENPTIISVPKNFNVSGHLIISGTEETKKYIKIEGNGFIIYRSGGQAAYPENVTETLKAFLSIENAEVEIENITIDPGQKKKANASCLYVGKGAKVTLGEGVILEEGSGTSDYNGTAVGVSGGTLIMNNGIIQKSLASDTSGNTGLNSSVIYVYNGGSFIMNGGEISGNQAGTAGVIYAKGGTLVLNEGAIKNNTYFYPELAKYAVCYEDDEEYPDTAITVEDEMIINGFIGGVEIDVNAAVTNDTVKIETSGISSDVKCYLIATDSDGAKTFYEALRLDINHYQVGVESPADKTYTFNFVNEDGILICEEYIYDGAEEVTQRSASVKNEDKIVQNLNHSSSFTTETINVSGDNVIGGRVYVELKIGDTVRFFESVECDRNGHFDFVYDYSNDEPKSTYTIKLYEVGSALEVRTIGLLEEAPALSYVEVTTITGDDYNTIVSGVTDGGITTWEGLVEYIEETQYASDAFGTNLNGVYTKLTDDNKEYVMTKALELILDNRADEVALMFADETERLYKKQIDDAVLKGLEDIMVGALTGFLTDNKDDIGISDELWQEYLDNEDEWEGINKKFVQLNKKNVCESTQDIIDYLEKAIKNPVKDDDDDDKGGNIISSGNKNTPSYKTPEIPVEIYEPIQPKTFSDVAEDFWGYEAITSLATRNIINGVGDGNFAPEETVTREAFVKMLVEALGLKANGTSMTFSDAEDGQWYTDAVNIASSIGLANGYDGKFGIGDGLTREQMATMLYRAANLAGIALDAKTEAIEFTDATEIGEYAIEAVNALSQAGIINGIGDGSYAPKTVCTRAMAAKVIYEILAIK